MMGRHIYAVSSTPADVVTLSGTTGSPTLGVAIAISPADADMYWAVHSNGRLGRYGPTGEIYLGGGEWCNNIPPTESYWVRATVYAGTTPSSGTIGSWEALTSTRQWHWDRISVGTTSGTLKIEIATDSGGSTIVATGYYEGQAIVET